MDDFFQNYWKKVPKTRFLPDESYWHIWHFWEKNGYTLVKYIFDKKWALSEGRFGGKKVDFSFDFEKKVVHWSRDWQKTTGKSDFFILGALMQNRGGRGIFWQIIKNSQNIIGFVFWAKIARFPQMIFFYSLLRFWGKVREKRRVFRMYFWK